MGDVQPRGGREVLEYANKKMEAENCPCRLCNVYVQNTGFVEENLCRR